MDAISEARLANIYPRLADKIRNMAVMLQGEGIDIRVVQGLRTWAEQDALYAQGRTAPGKIVTNARGGESQHCYGIAADIVPSQFGPGEPFNPDWNENHPNWQRMIAVGTSLGLESGSQWRTFKDWPHFQFTDGRFPTTPDQEMKELYANGGTSAIWAEIDKRSI